jgi:hypothetical protein
VVNLKVELSPAASETTVTMSVHMILNLLLSNIGRYYESLIFFVVYGLTQLVK